MGIDRTAIVGPYVACKSQGQNRREIAGALLGDTLYVAAGDSLHDWQNEHSLDVYLANRNVPNSRKTSVDRDEVQVTPITPELVAQEIEQFSDFFEKELFLLRQEYGDENVAVQWGVIHEIS